MTLWITLAVNSIAMGGLLFLLSAGFSLIFGLMRIPNLTHGSFFMLGAYLSTSLIARGLDFWTAAVLSGLGVAAFGGIVERLILRRLPGAELAQVLVTLGLSFMVADVCLMVWTGDPIRIDAVKGVLELQVSASELKKRKARPPKREVTGVLEKYAALVGPANLGAVTHGDRKLRDSNRR